MPQKDAYHDSVRNALEKDGWTVTHDPLTLRLEDVKFYVDLGAEKIIEPTKKVAVEIKVFGGLSFLNEFEKAVGQYLIYEQFLQELFPERVLFLAVSHDIFEASFSLPSIRAVISKRSIKILVFDAIKEEIIKWID
jgi:XisH protein